MIIKKVYARIGIAGNPSDGFYGKTVSCCIRNFAARVSLEPVSSSVIRFLPLPRMDCFRFDSLDDLGVQAEKYGYYGAIRLIYATCALFHKEFGDVGERGFLLSYDTTIPRQVGLGGSSAIIVALLKALAEYYEVQDRLIPEKWAELAWRVEHEELGIAAGLQDRVVQTFGGLMYMDFAKQLIDQRGYGSYRPLRHQGMPDAFIAYTDNPRKYSGAMHNPVRYSYMAGDKAVIFKMAEFALLADQAADAIECCELTRLGSIIKTNWQLRRELYGDALLGEDNLAMIGIAQRYGCPAKFPGSGGAVFGLYYNRYEQIAEAYTNLGYHIEKVIWDI